MATAYTSLLGFALPVTGELLGTWGDVVNDNITKLVEDSIAGSATAAVTSGDWTLTTTGSGAANQARCAILIPTGTPGTTRNIIAPSSSKAYIVDNQSDGAVVVKGAATTGATVAAGTTALVAWDGSDFVLVAQDLANATGTLPVTKGGTGATSLTGVVKGNGTSAFTAGTVNLASEVTGTLPVANGGTGITSFGTGVATFLGTPSSANLAAAVTDETGSGSLVFSTSPTLTTPNLGTPSAATLTNATGLPIDGGTTGTLPVNRGGTGATSLTANNVLLGNGTAALQTVAPGSSGNILTSNGTTWTSAAPAPGGTEYVYKTANYTTSDKEGVLADTSGGAFTVTLPLSPAVGAQVIIADAGNSFGTNNLTVGRNGSTIANLAENLVLDINGVSVQFVYDGTTWEVYAQVGGSAGLNSFTRTSVTATAGQTVFNVTYVVGFLQVYLNGVLLATTDYTANNGTSVTLASPAALNDIVEFIAYNTLQTGTAATATNIAGGIASQIPYQSAPGTTTFIPNGTSGQALVSNGTLAPSFGTLGVAGGGTGLTSPGTNGNILVSNGTGWVSQAPASGGSLLRQVVFTSSGTWTKGSGTKYILVEGVGGGGGGDSVGINGNGGGGGAGGYFRKFIDVTSITSETVTIGAGGAASSSGGTTSFGSHCSATGGLGSTNLPGGDGGTATGGDLNIKGGGGVGAGSNSASGAGGASFFGGGGRAVRPPALDVGNGQPGNAYGSGGSGGSADDNNSRSGGAGKEGLVIVWEYA